ncbi:MAG: DUF4270 family protein [Reichenbachiella sp.]|uniref:DUF4270 family protein n=1 Tax=Reichenbachiella sp. TaxID=2184521 RepID=UPI003267B670
MSKVLIPVLLVVGFACMQEDPEIGSDFFDEVSFEILTWDTLTVNLSTVRYDSVSTSTPARLLVGQADHPSLNAIKCEAYFQVFTDLEYSVEDLNDADFQDAFLTLYYDGYYFGDTTQLMVMEAYEVSEEMELDDESLLYNYSSYEVKSDADGNPISIGSVSFGPRPYMQDSVEIPLDDTFARSLFDLLQNDQLTSADLLDELHGLKLKSSGIGAVVGFMPDLVFKINYLDRSESPAVERTLHLSSTTGAIQFNHVEMDALDDLFPSTEEHGVSSSELNNIAYIQSGLGLAIRVDLPYVRQLLSADEVPVIDEVNLELVFENPVPEEVYMLSSGLIVMKVDSKNNILGVYDESPELELDIEFDEEKKFVVDITDFVVEQLSINTEENEDAILIQFADEYGSHSLNYLAVSDQEKSIESSKIILNVLNIK